jgi:hypothetical protein
MPQLIFGLRCVNKAERKKAMEPTKIANWLNSAAPGSRICYHEGLLADDRQKIKFDGSSFTHQIIEPVSTIAKLMWAAYCKGKVILFQERVAKRHFRYWALKRTRR